jgi:outer membrane protein TolC
VSALALLAFTALAAEPFTLQQVVDRALERNPDVVNANLESDASGWSRLSGLAAAGPRLRVEGGVQVWDKPLQVTIAIPGAPAGTPTPTLSVRDQVTSSAQVTVVQPLISLWPILEGLHIKDLGVDIAHLKQAQARRDVAWQATESFYRLLQAQRLVEVSEASVGQVQAQVNKARAFEGQGLMGRNDVLRAELALASAKQRVLQIRGAQSLALARLRTLLRLGPDEPLAVTAPEAVAPADRPHFVLEQAQQAARAQRSELREIEARLGQAQSARRIAWAKMLPSLNALGSYQYTQGQALAQKDQFFMGVSAQWDVFEWGGTYFGTREAAVRERQAALGLERLRDAIDLDTQASFVSWGTAQEALGVAEQAVGMAEENYRIESRRYENAANTTFDVLDAEAQLTQARAQRENAWFDLLVAQAGMRRAMGDTDVQAKESGR